MDIQLTHIEAQIADMMDFIKNGEMQSKIDEHGPWFAIGWMRRGIEMLSEELERVKELAR